MHSFLTFKSGKFYFSDGWNREKVNHLLVQAELLNETVVDLPILPRLADQLNPDIMYSSISGTAMIEGNPITGEDVRKIAEGEDIESYTQKDKQEIKNLIEAYMVAATLDPPKEGMHVQLTEELIRELHKIITMEIPHEQNVPGQYRNGLVYVGDKAHGGIYTPPKVLDDVKNLMGEYLGWINSPEIVALSPFIRAALAHYYFCLIHPFWDGNGRTARLIEAILLQTAGIKYVPKELSNYYYRNVDDYYIAFSKTIKLKKDVTPFLTLMLKASVESLQEIKKTIIYFIRVFSLKDYYAFQQSKKHITKRQLDLLNLLLDYPTQFTLKDLLSDNPFAILYRNVSVQTARRDLKKLTAKDYLTFEQGKFSLNMKVLG